ncbi:hypothetical protein [Micromonospora echinofusca]|uniref:Uncharacterized protein n=1 Tax=Micromonospora echinofusca TaxID=47858 RepID=A0ABS3W0F4_MICEH|nr:hypothetical protein [Micromonospora echinofusca]MBO4210286.1 hypothetical protein [Micromonospora echinofusca]
MTDIDGAWPDPGDDGGGDVDGWPVDGPQPHWWPPGDDPTGDDLLPAVDGGYPPDEDDPAAALVDPPPDDDPAGHDDAAGGPPRGVDVPVGADPDLPAAVTDPADLFPPPLAFDGLPEPVDGYPWADPGLLGEVPVDAPAVGDSAPPVVDLAAWAGTTGGWPDLAADPDPVTAALARFWGDLPPTVGPGAGR